jgi:hypothetical protein
VVFADVIVLNRPYSLDIHWSKKTAKSFLPSVSFLPFLQVAFHSVSLHPYSFSMEPLHHIIEVGIYSELFD